MEGFLTSFPQFTSICFPPTHTHTHTHTYVLCYLPSNTLLERMRKENHWNVHPIDFTKIYTFIWKRNLCLTGSMNEHFRVTMPLTHCTLAALTIGTRSAFYKITNPANCRAGVDRIQWDRVYSHPFVPWILWWFLWVNFEPRKGMNFSTLQRDHLQMLDLEENLRIQLIDIK